MSHKTEALFNGVEGLCCLGRIVHEEGIVSLQDEGQRSQIQTL